MTPDSLLQLERLGNFPHVGDRLVFEGPGCTVGALISTPKSIFMSDSAYFQKTTNLQDLTSADIHQVEQLLNNRPRKYLHYRTPYEVFPEARGALDV